MKLINAEPIIDVLKDLAAQCDAAFSEIHGDDTISIAAANALKSAAGAYEAVIQILEEAPEVKI